MTLHFCNLILVLFNRLMIKKGHKIGQKCKKKEKERGWGYNILVTY